MRFIVMDRGSERAFWEAYWKREYGLSCIMPLPGNDSAVFLLSRRDGCKSVRESYDSGGEKRGKGTLVQRQLKTKERNNDARHTWDYLSLNQRPLLRPESKIPIPIQKAVMKSP